MDKQEWQDKADQELSRADLEAQFRLGDQAGRILKWLEADGQLFLETFRQIQQDLVDSILSLSPAQREEFSSLKAQLNILYEPLNRLRMIQEMGLQAKAELDGKPTAGGIL